MEMKVSEIRNACTNQIIWVNSNKLELTNKKAILNKLKSDCTNNWIKYTDAADGSVYLMKVTKVNQLRFNRGRLGVKLSIKEGSYIKISNGEIHCEFLRNQDSFNNIKNIEVISLKEVRRLRDLCINDIRTSINSLLK
jgi:hypothetical protein